MYSLRHTAQKPLRITSTSINATPMLITSIPQQITTQTKIQVLPVADNDTISSRARLRAKIQESRNQRRLKVNWSALNDL